MHTPDLNKPFTAQCDAGDNELCTGIIFKFKTIREEKPDPAFQQEIFAAECNYSTIECEYVVPDYAVQSSISI